MWTRGLKIDDSRRSTDVLNTHTCSVHNPSRVFHASRTRDTHLNQLSRVTGTDWQHRLITGFIVTDPVQSRLDHPRMPHIKLVIS